LFRPYYDIVFAPNNKEGISLTSPTGVVTDAESVTKAGRRQRLGRRRWS